MPRENLSNTPDITSPEGGQRQESKDDSRKQEISSATGIIAMEQAAELLDAPSVDVESTDSPNSSITENTAKPKPSPKKSGNRDKEKQAPKQGTRRGHPMKQVKQNLAQQGKLNAKKPLPPEVRRARRRKRKRK